MSQDPSISVLVIDDDPDFLRMAEWMLSKQGAHVLCASDYDQAVGRIEERTPGVVLLDQHLDTESGLDLIAPLARRVPGAAVVLMTAASSTDLAVAAIQAGAFDFVEKPLDEARLVTLLNRATEREALVRRLEETDAEEVGFEGMIGECDAMRRVFDAIRLAAPAPAPVMIQGESGTGKELVARALHQRGAQPDGPFIAINMAALPAELVESSLFGHEKGAFTGAESRRIGACEQAQGGTLFLDEITEMPIELQAKLLRFLQEGTYQRVGSSSTLRSDARIVTATNRRPLDTVQNGRFREDLYYRLNVVPIELPALRDRAEDIPRLAQHALDHFARKYHKPFREISAGAMARLLIHRWPGNVRELMHAVERAVILNNDRHLTEAMLSLDSPAVAPTTPLSNTQSIASTAPTPGPKPPLFAHGSVVPMAELERMAIEHALECCGGSPRAAARALGISPATVYRKLQAYRALTA